VVKKHGLKVREKDTVVIERKDAKREQREQQEISLILQYTFFRMGTPAYV
jgi:hypothetical protein